MGVEVSLVAKNRNRAYYIPSNLSRSFCTLLCGPDAYLNCELEQLEQLFAIDLGPFRQLVPDLETELEELEDQLDLAKEAQDKARIQTLSLLLQKEEKKWEQAYEHNQVGWVNLEQMEALVQLFKEKLVANPTYFEKLAYNVDWGAYFHPERAAAPISIAHLSPELNAAMHYTNNILLEDLTTLLDWMASAKKYPIKYVTFAYH